MALGAVVSSTKKQNIPVETCAYATHRASLHDESELLHHAAALAQYRQRIPAEYFPTWLKKSVNNRLPAGSGAKSLYVRVKNVLKRYRIGA